MSEPETTRMLLAKACEDYKALTGMMDRNVFSESIFGFHAQQAIEKTLKAWLAHLGTEFPATHDLAALLQLLEESGENVEPWTDLLRFNLYAVLMRYVRKKSGLKPLDRAGVVQRVGQLIDTIASTAGLTLQDLLQNQD